MKELQHGSEAWHGQVCFQLNWFLFFTDEDLLSKLTKKQEETQHLITLIDSRLKAFIDCDQV